MEIGLILILIVTGVSLVSGKPVTSNEDSQVTQNYTFPELDTRPCPTNPYCNGFHLPLIHGSLLKGREIQCDTVDNIDENCCLSIGYHYVCYNITIRGEYLSMDQENIIISTDFSKICEEILPMYNKTAAAYTMIITETGQGTLAYRYGEWQDVRGSTDHIKHLACQFEHSYDDPPETDAYITPEPTTESTSETTESNGEATYTSGKGKNKKVVVIKKEENKAH